MSSLQNSRSPRIAPPPRPHRVSVAVLASRWHFDYAHYAAVLEVRSKGLPSDDHGARREPVAIQEARPDQDAPGLRQFFSRAIDTLRRRRGGALEPEVEISRAS